MGTDNIIHIKVECKPNSLLEKNIKLYLDNLNALRKQRKELYQAMVEKQIKKIEKKGY